LNTELLVGASVPRPRDIGRINKRYPGPFLVIGKFMGLSRIEWVSAPLLQREVLSGGGAGTSLFWRLQMAHVETDETDTLIASNKVEGTAVYNPDGEKLGSIYNFMVDKEDGQVEYAVLQFGGFLGMGADYYPVPWTALEYDEAQGGYVIDVDKKFLESAPRYAANEEPRFTPEYGSQVDAAYGVEYGDA
jgi:sporulation protein YlmC with PRC-barrel domain